MKRGRGQPRSLTADQCALVLDLLCQGERVGDVAQAVGVARDTLYATRGYDPGFDEAFGLAVGIGRQVRRDRVEHGTEYRYVHLGCRQQCCTAAATAARQKRLANEQAPAPTPLPATAPVPYAPAA